MSISSGNSKIGMIPNISLRPVLDCGNCKHCRKSCYALKAYRMYSGTKASWNANSKLARKDPDKYFGIVSAYLAKKQPVMFRWHVAGDILDQSYLDRMVEIAVIYPNTRFLVFTKMFDLDYSRIPENLSVIFSRWPGDSCDKVMPFAWVQDGTETRIPPDAILCVGNCETCGMCWSLGSIGRDVYFNIH